MELGTEMSGTVQRSSVLLQDKKLGALLIASHASVNALDGDGHTPVSLAIKNGNTDAAEFLRQHGGLE